MLERSLILTTLVLFSGCGKTEVITKPADPTVEAVAVSPRSAALRVGDTLEVAVAVTDMAGEELVHDLSWIVRTPRVASHLGQERLVAVDTGTTYVVGLQGGKSDSLLLIVTGPPQYDTFLSVTPTKATLLVGDSLKLTASGGVRGGFFVWSVTDSAILSVTQSGVVRSKKVGNATVTVFASPDPTNVANAFIQVK